jgi:heme-degrading monooxygenase HmoA
MTVTVIPEARKPIMVARHWRGWTAARNADAYEALLTNKVIPALKELAGYRGGYILRGDGAEEVEFVVINLFDSIEAVQRFAGPDYAAAVFEPEALLLLSRFEPIARHYEVRSSTCTAL